MSIIAAGCINKSEESSKLQILQTKVDELQSQVDAYKVERAVTAKNLKTFDDLDLVAFNNGQC